MSAGGITKELFAFRSFSLAMKEASPLPQSQSRRTDRQEEGGRQFVKEQQPSWLPLAHLLKCRQFQRKVVQDKVGAKLLGSWQAAPPQPLINLS